MKNLNLKNIIVALLVVIFCVSAFTVYTKISADQRAENEYESIRESIRETTETVTEAVVETKEVETTVEETEESYELSESLRNLMESNDSVIGWLTINDTKVDYPLVQNKEDNEYFLHRDINGKESFAGAVFMDSNHDITRNGLHVVYGHNMKNGTMFKDIVKFTNSDFLRQHQNITIWTADKEIKLRPVYAYAGKADGTYRSVIESRDSLDAFFKEKGLKSIQSDNVFVFVTCSYGSADERTYLICEEVAE